jgi:hypothetical protein
MPPALKKSRRPNSEISDTIPSPQVLSQMSSLQMLPYSPPTCRISNNRKESDHLSGFFVDHDRLAADRRVSGHDGKIATSNELPFLDIAGLIYCSSTICK